MGIDWTSCTFCVDWFVVAMLVVDVTSSCHVGGLQWFGEVGNWGVKYDAEVVVFVPLFVSCSPSPPFSCQLLILFWRSTRHFLQLIPPLLCLSHCLENQTITLLLSGRFIFLAEYLFILLHEEEAEIIPMSSVLNGETIALLRYFCIQTCCIAKFDQHITDHQVVS